MVIQDRASTHKHAWLHSRLPSACLLGEGGLLNPWDSYTLVPSSIVQPIALASPSSHTHTLVIILPMYVCTIYSMGFIFPARLGYWVIIGVDVVRPVPSSALIGMQHPVPGVMEGVIDPIVVFRSRPGLGCVTWVVAPYHSATYWTETYFDHFFLSARLMISSILESIS